MQSEELNSIYHIVDGLVTDSDKRKTNWQYGYNEKYDMVVISKDGTIGDVYEIKGLRVALPRQPKHCYERSSKKKDQYWEREELPKELSKISTIFKWNEMPHEFKDKWIDYIEEEFERRESGHWFTNNGVPTYITGSHYMYLQWSTIDIGYPDFREANRILFIHWEACKADTRSFGQNYLKIRRSGFSFMGSSEVVNLSTMAKNRRVGILSKTGSDAKKTFTDKAVPIANNLPFFFKPIQDGMDKPKTEMAYRVPASKITKNNMNDSFTDDQEGLNTSFDWKNTDDNSYDGEKLLLLLHDESGKWLLPNSILANWRVTKTCLRLGSKIIGKCMMGSTCNELKKGGDNFKSLYMDSDVSKRSKNGQTKSGLYSLFIPMEWNMEGFIDKYGMPVLRTPEEPVVGIDGEMITKGAIDFWEDEVESLKNDSDALNEFYRQFPRTESHAFRDESKGSLFNLTKIYQHIDHNDSSIMEHHVTRGRFYWKDGNDSEVAFAPDRNGRFFVSWTPPRNMTNLKSKKGGQYYPVNVHIGAFGCDSYGISGVVGGGGSNGALHGLTGFHMADAPVNEFFLEYIARPQTAEIFYEDVLMACVFYSMPILAENNKPRLLYHFKNRGYRGFCMNRPDKQFTKLSKTERELGGIPNTSESVKQAHATAIESYIEEYIGIMDDGEINNMPFQRTLKDWARFDINNRTRHDASISSGLACMAVRKHIYQPVKKSSEIKVNFARYRNNGTVSEIIR